MPVEREKLEADVLIIGAGPGGLACALHLANLIEEHTAAGKSPALSAENIYVLEKAREIGAHQLSGAIMDPRGLRELVPDFEKTAPLDTPVTGDAAYYFTKKLLPAAHHASSAAKPRQLCDFVEQAREMAGRVGGSERRESFHAVCGPESDL